MRRRYPKLWEPNSSSGTQAGFITDSTPISQIITQNIPMVISTNFVLSGISNWTATGGTPNTPATNNLTVYTIQKQT